MVRMVVYAGRVAVLAFIAARLLPYQLIRLFDIAVPQVIAAPVLGRQVA